MRRKFALPEADDFYLNLRGLPWETIVDQGAQWLIVHNFLVPNGYKTNVVTAALRIESGYPDVQLDMVYFFPHLIRCDGQAIGSLSQQQLDGNSWQRWSRHRTDKNPWRAGEDNIETHLMLVTYWLERELVGRAA